MSTDELKPLAASLGPLIASSSASAPSTNQRQAYAAERARLLFGQFRKGEANDPDTYTASIAAALSEYPDDVIRQVTDPRTGLGGRLDWLPTVKEVRDFCREVVDAEARAAKRERDLQIQIAGRSEYERVRKAAPACTGFVKPEPVAPAAPDLLYRRVQEHRERYGDRVQIAPETRAILEAAGYRL